MVQRLARKSHAVVKSRGVFAKTRLCVYHMRGRCVHGAECEYAHELGEVKDTPDLRKTTLCDLYEKGKCWRTDCRFAHGVEELRGTEEIFKTSLCRFWLNHNCAMGTKCRHAHGVEELRVLQAPVLVDEQPTEEEEKELMMELLEKLSAKHPIELSLATSLPTTAAGTPAPGTPRTGPVFF